MDLDSRVDARVVANAEGCTRRRTDVRTDGKSNPYIAPYLRQARQKICLMYFRCVGTPSYSSPFFFFFFKSKQLLGLPVCASLVNKAHTK